MPVGRVAWSPVSSRIEVELTSVRPDGIWTWRAAGARQPKGVLDGSLLPGGARVGDVVRAEADIDLEGITITSVLPPKGERKAPARLELLDSGRDDPMVSTNRGDHRSGEGAAPRRPVGRRDTAGRDPRPEGVRSGPSRPRPRPEGPSGERRQSDARPPTPELPVRPKPRKLRPGRTHRDALIAELPREQQPIAEQTLRGGLPAVRTALEEQNAAARKEGRPEAPTAAVLAIAERLLPRIRLADWLDRAEAALADAEQIALADLRSVVVSADDVAREEQTRDVAAKLRDVLDRRTREEQAAWRDDFNTSLERGRVVRALRLSSRSPVPGERLPEEAATRLAEAAGKAMTADVAPERWATLLDAVAYSTVRRAVAPEGIPPEPGDELLAQVRKHAGRVPAIAARFGIEAPAERPSSSRRSAKRSAGVRPSSARPDPVAAKPSRPRRIPPPPTTPPPPTPAAPGGVAGPAEGGSRGGASDERHAAVPAPEQPSSVAGPEEDPGAAEGTQPTAAAVGTDEGPPVT